MSINDCKVIHETGLKVLIDLWDAAKSIKDIDKKYKSSAPSNYSSVARAASNLTLVFPVICSRNISPEVAGVVNKALEKNAASMMQKLFASWQLADQDINNVQDYINQFHNNINTRAASLDDVFDLTSRIKTSKNESTISDAELEIAFREDAKNLDYVLDSDIKESSLRNFTVKNGTVSYNPIREADVTVDIYDNDATADSSGDIKVDNDKDGNKLKTRISVGGNNNSKSAHGTRKDIADYFSKQIPDADYKKANELLPTPITVNFQVKVADSNGNPTTRIDGATVGVKSKLYPIGSKDIVDHVGQKMLDKRNWLLDFIKATTRETSFFKDFLLAIDKAKIDSLSLSDRKATTDKMWKVLERRALNSKFRRVATSNPNAAAAITTLVLSQEEVDYMRKFNNMDVEHISNVIGLFESLNLMCIVIVDETLEVAKFIYDDNDPMWETISFTHLERESNDNTYKRVVNLMTKIS